MDKPKDHAGVSKHATELSKLGASKGGRARASTLSPQERREIGRNAVLVRWKKQKGDSYEPPAPRAELPAVKTKTTRDTGEPPIPELPYSMLPGTLTMGDVTLECHVLNDGRRVLTQREMVRMISGGRESGNLARYLERNPLTSNMLLGGPEILFRTGSGGASATAHGFDATILVDICTKYLEAREQGLLRGSQLRLAKQAEIVVRSCAKVGIIALIDEATGYQNVRAKRALQLKLQAFIAEEMQEWAIMFPEEFWLELARLEGIRYSPRSRPLRWGKYVMAFVYDAIDKDVGKKLREINPNPHFKMNHHQWLQKFGKEKVNNQLQRVIAIMKLCNSVDEFKRKFARVFRQSGYQPGFDDIEWSLSD